MNEGWEREKERDNRKKNEEKREEEWIKGRNKIKMGKIERRKEGWRECWLQEVSRVVEAQECQHWALIIYLPLIGRGNYLVSYPSLSFLPSLFLLFLHLVLELHPFM